MKPSIWSEARRRSDSVQPNENACGKGASTPKEALSEFDPPGTRSIFQQDYDRLLFSTVDSD